ncbi:hypothetical protein Tco_0007293 [Tanacetum coccineum]
MFRRLYLSLIFHILRDLMIKSSVKKLQIKWRRSFKSFKICASTLASRTLTLMPRFAPTIKNLLMNKEKLFELAKIPLNENCSAMLLKKLPKKLEDPDKFLIPCDFPRMDVTFTPWADLADLREIELLLNRDPSTDFSPTIMIDLNPERFINEPALVCLPPPGDDDDVKGLMTSHFLRNTFRRKLGTDNQEKNEKQSQNNKTGLGMEKTVKDKAKSKPESQSSQKVNRKVNWSKSKSTPGPKFKKYKFRG